MLFCRDEIWDPKVFWNTTNPNFTDCSQNILLLGVSGVYVCLFPVWLGLTYRVYSNQQRGEEIRILPQESASGFTGFKLIFSRCLVYFFVFLLTIIVPFLRSDIFVSDILYSGLLASATICSIFTEIVMKRMLIHTSVYNTVFWCLMVVVSIPGLKISVEGIIDSETPHQENYHSIIISRFVLIFLSAALQAFSNTHVLPPDSPLETRASVISTIFFSWYTGLVYQGWRTPLELDNVPELDIKTSIPENAEIFKKEELKHRNLGKRLKLWSCLFRCFSQHYFIGMLIFLVRLVFVFCAPMLVKIMIRFIENKDEPVWRGYLYAGTLFLTNSIATLLDHNGLRMVCISAKQSHIAIITAVYRKSLRLSNSARKKFTTGEITNHISVDAQRLMDTIPFSYFMMVAPVEILVAFTLLYLQLGVSIFAAVGVLLFMIPLNIYTSNKAESYYDVQLKAKDERIKLMNEIISGIKVLKLYAWEIPFAKEIINIRSSELSTMRYVARLWSLVNFTFSSIPFLMTLAAFFTFIYSSKENNLTTELIFVCLSLFNSIRTPLALLPLAIISVIKLIVSIKRLEDFLNAEELTAQEFKYPTQAQNCIEIKNGTFCWGMETQIPGETESHSEIEDSDEDNSAKAVLSDINLSIEHGKLVAIVGQVGAGKSSLLSAILGELEQDGAGQVLRSGSVAYVAQQAWIQNLTVKDNILFSGTLDEELYQKTIKACSLESDLTQLPAGDSTEIGENGINLSGGQKQRVALARAVYQQADVYLFDDPLAALDAHVGADVFQNVISNDGILKDKTRVLVTHNLWAIKHVDRIIVIRDGKIAEDGTYQQLRSNEGHFAEFLRENTKEDNVDDCVIKPEPTNSNISDHDKDVGVKKRRASTYRRILSENGSVRSRTMSITSTLSLESGGEMHYKNLLQETNHENPERDVARLTEDEQALAGNVKWAIFTKYFKALGWITWLITLLLYFICQTLNLGTNIVLAQWTDDANKDDNAVRDRYMIIYASIGVTEGALLFIKELTLYLACVKASRVIHENLLNRMIHSPMEFYDTNPIGRILNRFSTDIDCIDQAMPFTIDDLLNCAVEVLGVLVIVSYSTPWFLAAIFPLTVTYFILQRFYISTSRQLRRIEMISISPIYAHFTETLTGASSIRAFGAQQRFVNESERLWTRNSRCNWSSLNSNRWLGIRLESLGNVVIFLAALLAVIGRDSISGGTAGLSLSYSLICVETLNWLVRMVCTLETNAISLERVFQYTDETIQEASWTTAKDSDLPPDWPHSGEVELSELTTAYRDNLPPVLKNINIKIKPGEKLGVCGRTGAGKSSLTLALFRIMENRSGKVLVDGLDISTLGLNKLRSRITIIPQDPVLFSRSLRFNLDPMDAYSDLDVKNSLELAGLAPLATQLDMQIQEKGENLSVGQRQLVCLARAILRKTKILVLDEATAAVDVDTDTLVQQTIRREFTSSTVITIAHRLHTIMDSDRIMVLESGILKEFETPKKLLEDSNSIFYSLAKESGLV